MLANKAFTSSVYRIGAGGSGMPAVYSFSWCVKKLQTFRPTEVSVDSSANRSVATSGLLAARKGFTNLPVSGAKPIANIANGQRTRCAPANFLHVGLVPRFDLEKLLHASLASQAFLFLRWRLLARTRVVGQLVCLADFVAGVLVPVVRRRAGWRWGPRRRLRWHVGAGGCNAKLSPRRWWAEACRRSFSWRRLAEACRWCFCRRRWRRRR